jgi:Flp pilus assembly protein TadD
LKTYKEAVRLNPDDAEVYNSLGGAYWHLRRYEESAEAYKEAVRLNPDFSAAHANLVRVYLAMGKKRAAKKEHKKLKKLDDVMGDSLLDFMNKGARLEPPPDEYYE